MGKESVLYSRSLLISLYIILGFLDSSVGKESACNAGDPSLIPGLEISAKEGLGNPLQYSWASPVAQLVKNLPTIQETWLWILGSEDLLEKGKATHFSILENSMDCIVQGVTKSWTLLRDFHYCCKSLQSCLTLYDSMDCSLPGSSVRGILQSRVLEWVAISFSNAWKWKVKRKSLSHVQLFATPWTAAHQAPLSVGFSSQEYGSGVPLPSPSNSLKKG